MSKFSLLRQTLLGVAGVASLMVAQNALADGMSVHSTSFQDGHTIPKRYVAAGKECGFGGSVSPQVSWSDLPKGTKSVAILILDPDGRLGLTVSHWVAYNIDSSRNQLAAGAGGQTAPGITVGRNVAGTSTYRGMCPPAGDKPHHYNMTVIATDLPPGALPPGLDRQQLLTALDSHALGAQSVVGLFGH